MPRAPRPKKVKVYRLKPIKVPKVAKEPRKSVGKLTLERILNELPYDVIQEVLFAREVGRQFRTDYMIMIPGGKRLAIEYDGVNFRNANKSRHTSTEGFIEDITKHNLYTQLRIPCLRYTTSHMDDPDAVLDQILILIATLIKESNPG